MAFVLHPSERELLAWLDSGEEGKVDAHLQRCSRCANRLERLSGLLPSLRDALVRTLAVPEGYAARIEAAVAARQAVKADLELLAEMFTLPADTLRALSPDPDQDS